MKLLFGLPADISIILIGVFMLAYVLFGGMLEPANDRNFYAGAAYDF